MQFSYYFTQFTFIPLGIIFRFFLIFKSALPKGEKALAIIDFTSFSFFYFYKDREGNHKPYKIFLMVYSVLAFLALGFGLNMYF